MTCLSVHQIVLLAEIWILEVKGAECAAAETLSEVRRIVVFAVGEEFVSDLMKVSGVRDEVAEMQKDCPMVRDGAREIYHGALLVHDLVRYHLVHIYRARGGVVGTSVSCHMSAATFLLHSCDDVRRRS